MAVEVVVRPLRTGDLDALLAGLRQADRDEVIAASGDDIASVLRDSVRSSTMVWVAEIGGELACIFGCAPLDGLLGTRAAPWMLGTDVLDRHPSALMKRCRGYVADMIRQYPHLLNFVDVRNVRSIRWLKRLGFTFYDAMPYGKAGLPFHLFEMRV